MSFLRRIVCGLLVLCMVVSIIPSVSATETGSNDVRILLDSTIDQSTVWIDGVEYAVRSSGGSRYVTLPEGAEPASLVTYDYHIGNAADVHTQYPIGMQVWALKKNDDGSYSPEKVEELDNILQYSGSSIRITGNKGIRMITSIERNKKNDLVSDGLEGYKLLEYGTVLAWSSNLEEGNPLVLGPDYAKYNYAYKKDTADPVFAYAGNLMQYTNVLVGFSLDECKDDIAMRPYMILERPDGGQMTIYGGIVHRSIGYIAWQNKDTFRPGTAAYNYVWEIIRHVYAEITFQTNGGSPVESVLVEKGLLAEAPAEPEMDGHTFGGWYKDANMTEPFDFTVAVDDHMTLYAKWNRVGSLPMPENPTEKETYYWNNSIVLDVVDAEESEETLAETDAVSTLKDRGFVDYPIEYDYLINGSYVSDGHARSSSSDKHPVYYTYYVCENDDLWVIYVINGMVMAYPVTYTNESGVAVDVLISETESITSYDSETNRFYINIPSDTVAIVKTVPRIDAETLERLTAEEIDKLS